MARWDGFEEVACCKLSHPGVKLNLAFDAGQYTTLRTATCRSVALSGRRTITFFDDRVREKATEGKTGLSDVDADALHRLVD